MASGSRPSGWGTTEDTLTVTEVGSSCSKANIREARLVERQVCFILEAGNQGEGGLLSKGQLPTANQRARAFKGELQGCIGGGRGLRVETAQSALTVILKLVLPWSDQLHLDCFKSS